MRKKLPEGKHYFRFSSGLFSCYCQGKVSLRLRKRLEVFIYCFYLRVLILGQYGFTSCSER